MEATTIWLLPCLTLGLICWTVRWICILRKRIHDTRVFRASSSAQERKSTRTITVGFFHPYCNDGGGGERVLWCAIEALRHRDIHCIVYTGDPVPDEQILSKVQRQFGFTFPSSLVTFVHLRTRRWIEKERYPLFTLLGQCLGSMILAHEAVMMYPPDVMLDTMGYAFAYPLWKLLCPTLTIGCYVHYPIISGDMLDQLLFGSVWYKPRWIKWGYYRVLAALYGRMGRMANLVMVNSQWTGSHIQRLWKLSPSSIQKIYPPCNAGELTKLTIDWDQRRRRRWILSIGQFREEKNHSLQLRSFARFLALRQGSRLPVPTLVMIGNCRNPEDEDRLHALKRQAKDLDIERHVQFKESVSFDTLKEHLRDAMGGIHTMWCEHFGIGIVEMMAAQLNVVAHKSGGPMMDIIEDGVTGFLASSEEEYALQLLRIFETDDRKECEKRGLRARESTERFSDARFRERFCACLCGILPS